MSTPPECGNLFETSSALLGAEVRGSSLDIAAGRGAPWAAVGQHG
ncbi:hypothetical protein [Mycolicibacterium nivoides]|uniref:Uncharacterized protein n=1 Tax=Mycolicibacterium nivoides TaxID=2487344 RepID=A0ABW9LNM0_9MYCO